MIHKRRASFFSLLLVGALGLIFFTTSFAFAAAPAGTISYWKLDEDPAPLEYLDSVGTNNALPGVTAPAPNTDGIVAGAQDFDGGATQINVTDPLDGSFDFALAESFTIECWMKSTTAFDAGINQVIVGREDYAAPSNGMQWWLGMEPTAGNVTFVLIDNNQQEETLSAAVPINDGDWHHLVAIYDGTTPAVYLYVDKVKVDEELAPLSYTGDFSATDKDINLGWLDSGPGYYYEGTLDEVALYSRALTPGEIHQHYFTGLSGQGIDDLLTDVILLSPNGDEVIPSGSTYSIKWFAPLEAETFKLKFSVDNGATWKLIEEELTGTSYDWSVPTKKKNKKNCLVKVKAFDSNGDKIGVDQSDAPFTIEVLEVTSPNGEETLTSGDTYTITWTTNETKADVDKVKLLYTKNGGETWEKIETLEGGDPETYEWEVPPVNKVKTECRVKVTLKDELGNILGNDKSDSFFTIEPAE